MSRFDAVYRCRMCGEIYTDVSTDAGKGNQMFVAGIMYRATRRKEPEEPMEPELMEVHFCKNGNIGVADFQGLRLNGGQDKPVEKEPDPNWPICQNCGKPMVYCGEERIGKNVWKLYGCKNCYNQNVARKVENNDGCSEK